VSDAKLNLLVLKTRQLDRLRGFYAALGIAFAEERHGGGPTHNLGPLRQRHPISPAGGLLHRRPLAAAAHHLWGSYQSTPKVGPRTTPSSVIVSSNQRVSSNRNLGM
jgi:hypothetical protein